MPFPVDPLVVKIEFAFGADLRANPNTWVYIDRTVDWQPDRDLAATIGRADATSRPQPAKLSFTLKNVGGKYTKGNAMSPYWPYIRKNTPCRVTIDPGTGHSRVYTMYVTQWIPRWGASGDSGRQPLVQVVTNGVRRRLTQGSSPLRSPLFRAIAASNPIAWWSLEDGEDSTQAASGIPGGTPLTVVTGIMDFVDTGPPGATGAAKPQVDAANAFTGVITGGSNAQWQASIWARGLPIASPPLIPYVVVLEVRTDNGKIYRFALQSGSGGSDAFVARYETESDTSPSQSISAGATTLDGNWHLLQAAFTQSGGNVIASFWLDDVLIGTQTWTGMTLGVPIRASSIGQFAGASGVVSRNMQEIGISAIAVHNTAALVSQWRAGNGYDGETVHDRLVRLGNEQGVAMSVSTAALTRMGPQRPGPFVALLDECADVDGGILLDGLSPGFTYLARSDAYNLPVAVTVDMQNRQFRAPFEPLDDDANIVNDMTVSRVNGSSDHYVDETGPAGVDAIERYDSSATLNVYSDTDLRGQAAWRTHLGTAAGDALRFPGVGFDLHTAAGSALIEPWLQAGVRKRVQATHPPAEYGPGPIDLLVEGYTETVRSRRVLTVAANTSPYDPWRVFVLGQSRLNTAGSTVRATVPASATSLQVDVTGPLWATTAAPLDMDIDGIKVRVTAISGAASPQTLTVDPTTVVKPLGAGRPVRLWQPAALAL